MKQRKSLTRNFRDTVVEYLMKDPEFRKCYIEELDHNLEAFGWDGTATAMLNNLMTAFKQMPGVSRET